MKRKKGVAEIVGEVMLVAFAFAISLAYLAYVNSSFSQQQKNIPPSIIAEAQRNNLQILEFEHEGNSIVFTANMVYSVKVKTLITIIGFDKNNLPKPLQISEAYLFNGSSILFPNSSVSVIKLPPQHVHILYNEKYVALTDLGVTESVYSVIIPYKPSFILVKSSVADDTSKIKIIALTQVDNDYYEYSSLPIDLSQSG